MSDDDRKAKAATEKKIREQARQIAELTKAADANGKNTAQKGPNPQVKAIIRGAVKSDLWRLCKFLQNDDDQERAAKKLITYAGIANSDGVALDPKSEEPEMMAEVKNWVETYGGLVTSELNQQRCYAVQQMKDACSNYLEQTKNAKLPEVAEIEAVVDRTSENDEAWFFWFDKILPKAAANKDHWNLETRLYHKISEALVDNTAKKYHMSASTEAFALVAYEGNRVKWIELAKLKKKCGKPKVRCVAKKSQVRTDVPTTAYYDEETYPLLECTCTKPNAGQAKFGGWTEAALKRYAQLLTINKTARKSVEGSELEDAYYEHIRKIYNIKGKTPEEQAEISGSKKPKAAAAPAAKVAGLLWNSDSDE